MTDGLPARAASALPVAPAWLAVPAGVVAAGAILGAAPLAPDAARMLAITAFCVALWIGTPVDPWFTALLGIGLIGVGFSAELALTGFRSPATWLVVVGLLVGEAAGRSGLAGLVERVTLDRMPDRVAGDAGAAYRYLLVVLSAGSLALAVLVPSSLVRVLLIAPILTSIGEADVSIVLFLGAIFAIAEGLQRTAFTDVAARSLLSYLPADPSLPLVLVFVTGVSMALAFVMEGIAVASVITPVFVSFATAAGTPLLPVAMIESVALNTYVFPYQSAVLVAILGLDVVDSVELTRMASLGTIATLVILLPIQIGVFALVF